MWISVYRSAPEKRTCPFAGITIRLKTKAGEESKASIVNQILAFNVMNGFLNARNATKAGRVELRFATVLALFR